MHALASTSPVPQGSPDVVLVHGLGVSGRYLVPTARLLASHGKVFVPDLPGFGRSDPPGHVLGVPELTDALLAWMDAAALTRPCLLGNSLGCQVILEAAARHPERVDRLVLLGPTMDRSVRSVAAQVFRLALCRRSGAAGRVAPGARGLLAGGLRPRLQDLPQRPGGSAPKKAPLVRAGPRRARRERLRRAAALGGGAGQAASPRPARRVAARGATSLTIRRRAGCWKRSCRSSWAPLLHQRQCPAWEILWREVASLRTNRDAGNTSHGRIQSNRRR